MVTNESSAMRKLAHEGRPVSRGRATGTVRQVFTSPEAGTPFNKGDILVTTMTNPHFLDIMMKAGGVIASRGGCTSHPAIICRELKIPCIVGTGIEALDSLPDNQTVTMDGGTGEILIHN